MLLNDMLFDNTIHESDLTDICFSFFNTITTKTVAYHKSLFMS